MFNKIFMGLFLVLILSQISFSQDSINDLDQTNSISIYPLGIVFGNAAFNYEHLFHGKHGIMIQCSFPFFGKTKGYTGALHYRHHYFSKQKHIGLNSPFWGMFAYYEKSEAEIEDGYNQYNLKINFMKAGINWGRKWIFNSGFNICFRIGYGIPFIAEFDWSPTEPDNVEAIEALTKILGGIDGEFTIGYSF